MTGMEKGDRLRMEIGIPGRDEEEGDREGAKGGEGTSRLTRNGGDRERRNLDRGDMAGLAEKRSKERGERLGGTDRRRGQGRRWRHTRKCGH